MNNYNPQGTLLDLIVELTAQRNAAHVQLTQMQAEMVQLTDEVARLRAERLTRTPDPEE